MIEFEQSLMPDLYRVRQKWKTDFLESPEDTVIRQMSRYKDRIRPGSRIGIAAGSRGIYQYRRIIRAVVDFVRENRAEPFIIPAMGSHGGATAEGQLEVLEGYGITPESMGVSFLSSMETNTIGYTKEGVPVHFDKNACSMDGIIMVNRIKPHTDFHGGIESGIMKQMVIGLGKQHGASTIHRRGVYGLSVLMPEAARVIMDKMPILMGVAILENQQDRTAKIEVLPAECIETRERELLKEAKALLPALPCDKLDVLVLQEMGKNISGTGIDPNIVGRYLIRNMPDELPDIYRIVCLDLTEESHHNAIGMGIADLITRRMYEKIDFEPTYVNTMTSGFLERGFMPVVAESDREAIETALNCCNRYVTAENARMIMARNTLELQELVVSEALLPELEGRVEIMGKVQPGWDKQGYMEKLF
ncbi:DUF362 domain-containing protein [Eubacterium sp. 1001713B170207_170306_E7]|uniref:DUF362 domain-containing protein n=1 Tax=Eubacterium sp. 1001713B170207_170306_E7 TaxID=2787097 RepID=UPI00189A57A7|nr:DUF362 domain-containing protein [Eubacterium sp. 1001713B170207_170306_E7]